MQDRLQPAKKGQMFTKTLQTSGQEGFCTDKIIFMHSQAAPSPSAVLTTPVPHWVRWCLQKKLPMPAHGHLRRAGYENEVQTSGQGPVSTCSPRASCRTRLYPLSYSTYPHAPSRSASQPDRDAAPLSNCHPSLTFSESLLLMNE